MRFLCDEITDENIAIVTSEKLGTYTAWIPNGGQQTLNELYALTNKERKYIFEYLQDAPLYETVSVNNKDFLLTHSGLGSFDTNKRISEYSKFDLIWNRPSLNARYFDDIVTVFGHTPSQYYGPEYENKAVFTDTLIDIDTGAA